MSKKGTKAAQKTLSSYETRDIVLGKVRGYPPWPGMVVDPDSVPQQVSQERPASKKATFYCVQFFPTGDYAWLVAKDISKLQTHEIESYINEPFKKSGDLLQGYRIALDPKKWEADREAATHEAFEAEANAEVDQLDSETEGGAKKPAKGTKKRKRESDPASTQAQPKTKRTAKPKKDADAKPKKSAAKGKKNGARKSNAMVESEDEGEEEAEGDAEDDENAGPSKKASPSPPKKAKRDKDDKREKEDEGDDLNLTHDPEAIRVREWRHRLQKAFLGKTIPKEEDTPDLDTLFTTVENYDKITVQYLQFSKIGKVMRHIAVLTDDKVPRDAEFKFRERAKALVDRWHQVLNANKPNGSDAGGATNGSAPSAKGTKEEKKMTEGTAALDLNGGEKLMDSVEGADPATAPANDADAEAEAEVEGEGDVSMLGDVTMSEAGP